MTPIVINVPTERWPGILAEVVQIGKLLDRLNRDDLPDERIAAPAVRGRELTEIVATQARTPHSLAWCVFVDPAGCVRPPFMVKRPRAGPQRRPDHGRTS